MSNQTSVLQCASCGHQNEPERVYCHNCGQKLDRSLLPKVEEVGGESNQDKRRRVKRMMNPNRGGAPMRVVKTFVTVMVFAALVAATFLLFQKPADVPPRRPETIPERNAGEMWQALVANAQALNVTLTEDEVNNFLRTTLKPADSSVPGIKFERAFMNFRPGAVVVTVERSIFDQLSIYSSTTYAPRVSASGVTFEPVAVHFGRLGFDPRIPFAPGLGLAGVQKALEKEMAQFGRLATVEPGEVMEQKEGAGQVRSGTIKLVTKPAP